MKRRTPPSRFTAAVRLTLATAALTLGWPEGDAQAQLNGGQEFVVNSFFLGDQAYPDMAALAGSGFVVVWDSQDQDGSGEGVFGRLLGAAGVPSGTEFRVATETLGAQDSPSVASTPSGGFVVVWESGYVVLGTDNSQDGSSDGVFGQRFSSTATKLGAEFQVNTTTAQSQSGADVATDASGNFVVVWKSNGQDGNNSGVFGQRFNSSATKVGTEFQVNTTTIGPQTDPAVAMADGGSFVVVWTSTTAVVGTPPPDTVTRADVFAQLYASNGAAVGTEFMVNTYTTQNQDEADVSMDSAGGFVVVWESGAPVLQAPAVFGQDGDGNGVFARRFTSSGSPAGTEFQVNTYTTYGQDDVTVGHAPDGGFVIAWESITNDGDEAGIFAQRYDATGAALGANFQVNTTTSADQEDPAVAVGQAGDFVVAWEGFGQDSSYGAIVTRRFTTGGGSSTTTTVTTGTSTTTLPAGPCQAVPAPGCKGGALGKSGINLAIKGGAKDKFKWKLGKGDAAALADFLDPLGNAAARYYICVYDADGRFFDSVVPALGTCSGSPCWKATGSTGYKYKDKLASAGGIQDVKLKAGDTGKAQVQAKGKGAGLQLPLGPYALPVTAQLIADDGVSSQCWQTSFTISKKNTLTAFIAKGP